MNTVEKLHLDIDVAFYGNSITYASNFDEIFAADSLSLINLGYPGDNILGMINRLDMLEACHPNKIFLMAGINGLKDQSPDEFSLQYEQLVDSIQYRLPNAKILLESILPVNPTMKMGIATNHQILTANDSIRAIAHRKKLIYINLHNLYVEDGIMATQYTTDGLHLKPEAYKIWADEIYKYIKE